MTRGGQGRPRWARTGLAAVVVSMAAGVAACGGGSSSVVNSGTSGAPSSTTSVPPTTASPPPTTGPSGSQSVTVAPDHGLHSPQTVLVKGSGFSPNEQLVVNECAAKGSATGPGDCNLTGMQPVTSDATGRVVVEFTVVRGPFGANHIVCGPTQRCLVSVNQATVSPTEQAAAFISFG